VRFAAVELDALGERAVIRDLAALAHALVQPADRLAWLSLLRAPWCGLRAADLLAVACAEAMPLEALRADVEGLSQDGRARLARVREAIGPVLGSRGRAKLAARVRGAWLSLGGPAFADDASDLDAAERFFSLLGAHEYAGDIGDWSAFTGTLARLREADAAPDVRVRVMTLHKAKGLEFDTVVMPALARGAAKSDAQLLLWRRRDWGLLIAPDKARGGERDAVYGYLERLACDEEAAELGRLLYVGCTRAKSRLHLTGVLGIREDGDRLARWRAPPSDSALARLWPLIGDAVAAPTDIEAPPASRKRAALVRVALDWRPLAPQRGLDSPATFEPIAESLPFDWARETARHVGVVVHRLLAAIDREGIAAWDEARVASLAPSISLALAAEGVDAREIDEAGALVQQALSALLGDERGRWLFDRSHEDVRSEWALAGLDGDAIVHVRLDRAFVANGVRWIIDFKTGRHEGGDVEAFLDQERARYAPAMERYARLVRALDPRPIRLALYHPLVRGWREWEAAGSDPR
jgi:ATP-dependent exoDNAse (exonuclease V) beta subunit